MPNSRRKYFEYSAVTVDLEDWHHVCAGSRVCDSSSLPGRLPESSGKLLGLMREHSIKGTFFILGSVARQYPELAPQIASEGHEIASHGWSHSLVGDIGPEAFSDELDMTSEILETQTGHRPVGFRAPRWSICRKRTPWAFEILARKGYIYDSSLTPLPLIGDIRGPRSPHCIDTGFGRLLEFPPLVTGTPFVSLPTGGGWGFRFFPERIISRTIRCYMAEGNPAVIFVHPRELDPEGPRVKMGMLESFVTYGPRSSSAPLLGRLFSNFRFKTLGEIAGNWHTAF